MQRLREIRPVLPRQSLNTEEREPRLAEQVIVGAHLHGRADRRVGQHDINALDGQVREELFRAALTTGDPDRVRELQRRLDEPAGDGLRDDVVHANDHVHRTARRPSASGVDKLPPEGEDLVGIAIDELAHLGGHDVTPRTPEQLLTQLFLEPPDLDADGRRGQLQLGAGGRHAAGTHDHPVVEQMVVVEPLHRAPILQQS
jgi:hypothetical protein